MRGGERGGGKRFDGGHARICGSDIQNARAHAHTHTHTHACTSADIGTLVAQYDTSKGMVITWAPFVTEFECTIERKDSAVVAFAFVTAEDSADSVFKTISTVDSEAGMYTDSSPGSGGAQPVYRLCVSDGERTAYSQEAKIEIPFDFGSTGGNLQNGGIACEKDGVVYRLGIQEDEIGIYALDMAGGETMIAKGIASQINVAGGYLYYLNQSTSKLYRVPLSGGEPELICDEKLLFVLVIGSQIYGTFYGSDALFVMNADGSGMETLETRDCYDLGAYGHTLYYTNTDTGQFVMRDLITGEVTSIPMAERGFVQIWGDHIYYQDETNGKRLTRCALDGSDAQVLLDQSVTGINVTERGVYCVNRSDRNTMYRVALDGSESQQLTTVEGTT